MGDNKSNLNDELRLKFPDFQPISSSPSLFPLNGIGCKCYGKRDLDLQTGTYVTTHFVCFAFIPLFALKAYRVANAGPNS